MKTKKISFLSLLRNSIICLAISLPIMVASADTTSPLCFTAKNGNVFVRFDVKNVTHTFQYSTDSVSWFTYSPNTNISLAANQSVYFRAAVNQTVAVAFGHNDTVSCSRFYFTSSNGGVVESSGNIMSLYGPSCPNLPLQRNAFSRMFYNCSNLISSPELPATSLATACYRDMFKDCTSLVVPPSLPAMVLADSCYVAIFGGCTSLVTPPALPATTMARDCYHDIFKNCTSLSSAPELPATTLAKDCYCYMFYGCTSLTTPPELPATTLVDGCYHDMFKYCSGLTRTPVLPATNLDIHCYERMFYYCTSLTSLPVLPATDLPACCYYRMFWGCSSLIVNTSGSGQPWIINANTATADAVSNMFHGTSGTMAATPTIKTTYYVASAQYTVTPTVNDIKMGNVAGGGVYMYGATAILTANANSHYSFVSWSNGSTNSIISLQVTCDTTLTATFAKERYMVNVTSDNEDYGIVTGNGVYEYGDTVVLTANANPHYSFVAWSNGSTNSTISFPVFCDTTLIATFAKERYMVNVTSNNDKYGTVTGSGVYEYGDTAHLLAVANDQYKFVSWSNGVYTDTTSIVVTSDTVVTATFAQNTVPYYNVVININDTSMGSVIGDGMYVSGSIATLTAMPTNSHHFVRWSNGDTSSTTTIVVMSDTIITAYFDADDQIYNVTVLANYADRGMVTGSGQYRYNDKATLTAIPNSGYVFDEWDNGEKNQVIYITVVCDTVVRAIFKPEGAGVDVVNEMEYVVYSYQRRIFVNNVMGASVSIYDVNGRLVAMKESSDDIQEFDVEFVGIYFVCINDKEPVKVIVR